MGLLIASGQLRMERARIKVFLFYRVVSLWKLLMHWGKRHKWPRTVRFSSWLHWGMWRYHSYLHWRCQKILSSWGPKCQALMNDGWVENIKISTCPREALIIMKISPSMECRLQRSNLQMNIGTVLQTFRLSDINHTIQNLSLYFAVSLLLTTSRCEKCYWSFASGINSDYVTYILGRWSASTIWMKKGAEQISGEEGKRGGCVK